MNGDLAGQAYASLRLGRPAEAEALCRRAMKAQPGRPELLFLLAQILAQLDRRAEAARELEKAMSRRPDFLEAAGFAGTLYESLGQPAKAEQCYRRILARQPSPHVWFNLGNALRRQDRQAEALECYLKAHQMAPADPAFLSALVARKQALCDWSDLEALSARLVDLVSRGGAGMQPLRLLALECPEAVHFRCAREWGARLKAAAAGRAIPADKRRLTIGYLSADFHRHATAYLAAELFELHDRDRFEVVAYSVGPDDGSPIRQRLEKGFDRFHHLAGQPAAAIAERIVADGVDILIDLKGWTRDARPDVLALRPAPLQVAYLGYPGTMGVDCVDYVVADPVVLPMDCQPFYSERIVQLPDCYQVNDRRRPLPSPPSRAALGLPEAGRVLACFNAAYKITPGIFAVWMELLAKVEGAVLWLLADEPAVEASLRRAAAGHGVAAERLVFAPRLPLEDHLARYAAADLFLDTLPYNAHTTGSDALWMGCPLVTCKGDAFAARVGASLLRSVGLPQLIAENLETYRAVALRLLTDDGERAGLRRHLEDNRQKLPLFDTPRFTRHLETAYEVMARRHRQGLPPAPFAVDPIDG